MNDENLATYRVRLPNGLDYRSKVMDPDERLARNCYMRRVLSGYDAWKDVTDDDLERMTLCKSGDGYIVEDRNGSEVFLATNGVSEKEAGFRRLRAMMPFEFMDLAGKDFDWSKYGRDIAKERDTVNKYILNYEKLREHGVGLYICSGTKGSGKTMLSCCILNELAKRYSGSMKFVNVLDFLDMSKKGYSEGSKEIQMLYNASVLVIDDIGVQMSREWIETEFYRLINDRYNARKPIIYTSNIPTGKLKMDDRIVDRIESTTLLINMPEEAIRSRDRKEKINKLFDEIK